MTWHVSNSVRFWSKSENLTEKSDSDPNLHHFRNSHFSWVLPKIWHFCQERLEKNGQRHFMPYSDIRYPPPLTYWIKFVKRGKSTFWIPLIPQTIFSPSLHFAQIVSSSSDSSSAVRWNMQAWDHPPATPHCVPSQSNLHIQIQIQIQIQMQIQTHKEIQI